MTDSISPEDDAQTFEAPVQSVSIGTIGLVPQLDGAGACLYFDVPGLCQINVMVSEEAVEKFLQARRSVFAKRITLAKPLDHTRFPDLKKYRR